MMEIRLAKTAGFCFGVDRAIKRVEELLGEGKRVCTLGPIIHNDQVVGELEKRGVRVISSPEEATEEETVVIRSHGISPEIYKRLNEAKVSFEDATCPFVAKIHKIVKKASAAGKTILLTGDENHPEVMGIVGEASGPCFVVRDEAELEELADSGKISQDEAVILASQTTFSAATYKKCEEFAKKHWTNCDCFATICGATGERQGEAERLSLECDCMVVIGGRHSSNTKKLYAVCAENTTTHHIETAAELQPAWFEHCSSVGVTAGASTPSVIIKEVIKTMSEIEIKTPETEEFNFEEALENSLKTVYTGEKITGVVTAITPTDVRVEIGTKHMGVIPMDELSADPTAKAEDLVKIGDEIELLAIRVNDIEGIVTLSKKRLDAIRGVEIVNAAAESGEVLEGVVTEVVKGGVIANVNGVKVFVPASQATMSRNEDPAALKGNKVRLKVIEAGKPRKRAVGSIRQVTLDERKAAQEQVFSSIEKGKVYQGSVKSLTKYGAFVDIGGVDGMVHISELSWNRIKHPSEVVAVGDQIEVYVKDFNEETHRISLGYKKPEDNPWEIVRKNVQVGTVITAKVVSMPPFGVFVQIVPGVDGLIHISQLSTERIEKPSDLLELGQEVTAKVIEFDPETKRISLSMRALMEEKSEPAEVVEVSDEPKVYSTDDMDALKDATGEE